MRSHAHAYVTSTIARLCDTIAESDAMREQLQPHVDGMTSKPAQKSNTGFDLYVISRGGATVPGRQSELQQEWDRAAEVIRTEFNEKAKLLEKEQKKVDKMGLDTESDRHTSRVRHEPVGVDRQSRRYWLLKRSPTDCLLAVEISSQKPHEPPPQAYPVSVARLPRAWQARVQLPQGAAAFCRCLTPPFLHFCVVVRFAAR
jgi:hypothetical protein